MKEKTSLFTTPAFGDYELLDCGEEAKLERFGDIIVSRPDPQALWHKELSSEEWKDVHASFTNDSRNGMWKTFKSVPGQWEVDLGDGIRVATRLSSFKHVGIFPEHRANWQWMADIISKADREVKVLNLFGYTGIASLVAAQAGAQVCHVDGSKVAVTWARENAKISSLEDQPIRWIIDDVISFVKREIKRGNRYDGIIMDPPAFGHGPEKEVWKIERDFLSLIDLCSQILSPKPLFAILNGYAAGYSSLVYLYNLQRMMQGREGTFEHGELTIQESNERGFHLPCGIVSRWTSV
ncbi:MAG: class I SAM-dependent methyltransferase [bacterium]|nr:class I SAM-dependent methyltransferase [bacterium]